MLRQWAKTAFLSSLGEITGGRLTLECRDRSYTFGDEGGQDAALSVRDDRHTGRIVDIALADVLASYVAGNARLYIHHGLEWARNGRRPSPADETQRSGTLDRTPNAKRVP